MGIRRNLREFGLLESVLNRAFLRCLLAPLTGLEPVHTAPEADALSAELQGQDVLEGRLRPRSASGTVPASADGPVTASRG